MVRFLALVFVTMLLLANSVAYMMLGWGLSARSWMSIIGFGLVGNVLARLLLDVVLKDLKK